MGVTRSYTIPLSDLSLADRQRMREDTDRNITSAALRLAIRDREEDLIIRDTLPNTDLGVGIGGPAAGAGTSEDWLIQPAGVNGTELQYHSSLLALDRVIGFYGCAVESAAASISRLRLTLGAASSQVRGVFQLEDMYERLETAAYFSEVVIFTRQETIRTMVMPRVAFAALTERLKLLARTIEPIGTVVSAPST